MAGHSKWSNIKHRKSAQDQKRGKIFTKLIKEITIASKISGGDLDSNPRLRKAVNDAKSKNMPSEKIDRAIKKGTGVFDGVSYEEIFYEDWVLLLCLLLEFLEFLCFLLEFLCLLLPSPCEHDRAHVWTRA